MPISQLPFPLLSPRYLINDLTEPLIPRYTTLSSSQHVQTVRRNGLSRQHAVVWEDSSSKIIKKDINLSNGTIIHGERLSQEGVNSQQFELKGGGLSLRLILSRLEGELQKSKETGTELRNLTMVLDEIQDTLGGSLADHMCIF
ncbi:hypothetical protein M378DRAFT_16616 [Amanita muscaria Koide BX008]|uniref:FHA domain-containing protein n=1 Tax=Amanita muscaria (strain Koide BX008) TaxID=946122 RepID=A0A0C2W727_AMAMK|nr:hypothetical protein M378DRAFT_16616 [Amanita muscaria Koide BX008]